MDSRKNRKAFQALFSDEKYNYDIIDDFARMTKRKLFTEWLRDMWRLWKSLAKDDLSLNDLSVLYELFPKFKDLIAPLLVDNTELIEQIRVVVKTEIAAIPVQQLLPGMPPAQTGKSLSGGFKVQAPSFENEDDEIQLTVKKDNSAALSDVDNFMTAVYGLQESKQDE